jgi:hypothetical protein
MNIFHYISTFLIYNNHKKHTIYNNYFMFVHISTPLIETS